MEGWARKAPNVESLGWLGRAEVLGLLDASDVLVLPSRHETFGASRSRRWRVAGSRVVSPNCGISRWPELAPGLVVMKEGERAAAALGRVMGMRPEARAELSRAGRTAARALTEQTVREWAEVIGRTRAGPPVAVTARPAVVSVHDVTPEKLEAVGRVLDLLESGNIAPVTLLVVPGLRWDTPGIGRLREFVRRGYLLAGHGWEHRAPPPVSFCHRLHAALISRDQAEHLSRARADVRGRVRRCHEWFERAGLPARSSMCPRRGRWGTYPK